MKNILRHHTSKKIEPGNDAHLGAVIRDGGVNFAVFSQHAVSVYLLLFDEPDRQPADVIRMERSGDIWHIFVHGIGAGQLYGLKVNGPYDPEKGLRFNPYKLLVDPYAKALSGVGKHKDHLMFGYDVMSPDKDLAMDTRDNAHIAPKSIVVDDSFDWQNDAKPNIPMDKLLIYEVHLKGFTAHPSSGVKHPGTYLGFIEKIPYLKELGINAVEFLPIHEHYVQNYLVEKELTNYWGYDTIGYFAPESTYCTNGSHGCQVQEFKTLVRELHKAGIEVILDVVFNHTCEGNELGPTLCFKGIDNLNYYELMHHADEEGSPRYYNGHPTGCGNTLRVEHPMVRRLVLDSLRYWITEYHIDGFRFDLASALARYKNEFDQDSMFFAEINKDPLLRGVKLIAEPWDLNTYEVGNFPRGWSEWNDKFRDTVRRYLRGDAGQVPDLARRLTGSADLYQDDRRYPYNSINFITCHDGFTLNDLFSYNEKHNEANQEDNRDGTDDNISWNCGAEGETDDEHVLQLRKRMVKNAFCYLLFASGTPMMLGGDEFRRTQHGNNNVWCQDNEISWFDWNRVEEHADILEFVKKAVTFRRQYPVLENDRFFTGTKEKKPDIIWFNKDLETPDWDDPELRTICYNLDGSKKSKDFGDYHLFFIFHADDEETEIKLPKHKGKQWFRVIDTSLDTGDDFLAEGQEQLLDKQDMYSCRERNVVVLVGFDENGKNRKD